MNKLIATVGVGFATTVIGLLVLTAGQQQARGNAFTAELTGGDASMAGLEIAGWIIIGVGALLLLVSLITYIVRD